MLFNQMSSLAAYILTWIGSVKSALSEFAKNWKAKVLVHDDNISNLL